MSAPGALALVLHSHMPYVEGFDRWPFGEEWLWEAIASSYLPVLDVLEDTGAPVTLSLTPVLCDQLAAPGAIDRCVAFLREIRGETHRVDLEEAEPGLRAPLERSAAAYAAAAGRLDASPDLLAALAPHAAWTSSATHAVLPLLVTDAGARLQIDAGIASHRARVARPWRGGFWLPECAHAPWLEPLLGEAGAQATCVDLTDVLGRGSRQQLLLRRGDAGVTLVPIDRETMELVWSSGGYPADGAYNAYHRRTRMDNRAWAVDGSPYDADRATVLVREHAADFVARVLVRLRAARDVVPDPLVVCALDTELLGHWWLEGPLWLRAVIEESERQGLAIEHLDDAVAAREPVALPGPPERDPEWPVTSWGTPRDLTTWSGPGVEELAWCARAAELAVVAAGSSTTRRAARELLALQSSDWAFAVQRDLAAEYGRSRAQRHEALLRAELAAPGTHDDALRDLAPGLALAPLLG